MKTNGYVIMLNGAYLTMSFETTNDFEKCMIMFDKTEARKIAKHLKNIAKPNHLSCIVKKVLVQK